MKRLTASVIFFFSVYFLGSGPAGAHDLVPLSARGMLTLEQNDCVAADPAGPFILPDPRY